MCTTGQLLIYDSPEGEAKLPTCDLCFSLSSLAYGNHLRVSHTARYLDLLVSSHRAMSFKCRARELSRGGDFQSRGDRTEKSSETSYTNRRKARRPAFDQDGFMLIPGVRINARMSVHNVQISGNKLIGLRGAGGKENNAIFQSVNERRRSLLNKDVYRGYGPGSPSGNGIGF